MPKVLKKPKGLIVPKVLLAESASCRRAKSCRRVTKCRTRVLNLMLSTKPKDLLEPKGLDMPKRHIKPEARIVLKVFIRPKKPFVPKACF